MNRCDTCRMPRERHIDSGHDFYSRDEERAKLEAAEKRAEDAEARIIKFIVQINTYIEKSTAMHRRTQQTESERDALRAQLTDTQVDYGILSDDYKQLCVDVTTLRAQLADAEKRAADAEGARDKHQAGHSAYFQAHAALYEHNKKVEVERDALRVQLADVREREEKAVIGKLENELTQLRAQLADTETEDELARLKEDIEEHIPEYVLDDGTNDEANHRERIEYAGWEIDRLRAQLAKSEAMEVAMREALQEHARWCSRDDVKQWSALYDAGAATAERLKRLERVYEAAKDMATAGVWNSDSVEVRYAALYKLRDALAAVADLAAGKEPTK